MPKSSEFTPPSRAQIEFALHLAGEPCVCEPYAKLLDLEICDHYFFAVACRSCRARKALEMVRNVAEGYNREL